MNLDPQLLAIIRCPSCHGELRVDQDELACTACALVYPVRDDIPVLLIDQARQAD